MADVSQLNMIKGVHMDNNEKVVVKFKTSWLGYNKNNFGGFTQTQADHLIKIGAASSSSQKEAEAFYQNLPMRKGAPAMMIRK